MKPRIRFALLAALCVAAALMLHGVSVIEGSRKAAAEEEARDALLWLEGEIHRVSEAVRGAASAVSQDMSRDPRGACGRLPSQILGRAPGAALYIEIRDQAGTALCSSEGRARGEAARTPARDRRFSVVLPWGDDQGGTVLASVEPRVIQGLHASGPGGRGVSFVLASPGGEVVASSEPWPDGIPQGGFARLLAPSRRPVASMAWADGSVRVVAAGLSTALGGIQVIPVVAVPDEQDGTLLLEFLLVLSSAIGLLVAAASFASPRGAPPIAAAPPAPGDRRDGGEAFGRTLEGVADNGADVVFATDPAGRHLVANVAYLEMSGLDRAELARAAGPTAPPRNAEGFRAVAAEMAAAAAGVVRPAFEVVLVHPATGHRRRYDVRCHALRMEKEGPVFGSICFARDVTEERAAEAKVAAAREEIDESARSKTRFLAATSHDLRQPAQAAMLFSESLVRHVRGTAGEPILASLRGSLESMNVLLQTLMSLTQLETGGVVPSRVAFPLDDLVLEVVQGFEPQARAKDVALVAVPTGLHVVSDRALLGRMLRNLVENAVRYTERGRVLVDCHVRGEFARIEIRDSGVGISKTDLAVIWDEFSQLHNPERDPSRGLGIGLSIVRRLASLLRHPVDVVSEPGNGSVFWLELPIVRPGEDPPAQDEPAAPPAPVPAPRVPAGFDPSALDQPGGGTPLAVVIDDEAQVREGRRCILELEGYDVVAEENAADALAGISRWRRVPDVIVADYRLRENAVGSDAIRILRAALAREIPAVILTGEIGTEVQVDAASIGVSVLHKPVQAPVLVSVLEDLVASAPVA